MRLDINHRKKVNSALCAARKRVSKLTKTKSLTPLTRPTSLEMLLTGVSTSLRRLFAPAKGLPDSIVPIRQHGVQGQVLAITPLLPYQNINASQHTVSASRGVVTQCPVSLAFLSSASFRWGRIAARKRARSLPLARIGRLRSRVKTHALGACGQSIGRAMCGQGAHDALR